MSSNNDKKFYTWLSKVDKYIYSLIQVNLDELPDNTFRLDFNEGFTYQQMADKVIKDTEWEIVYFQEKNK